MTGNPHATPITRTAALALAGEVCALLEANAVPHLLYGSAAYALVTGDEATQPGDLDIIVRQSDFDRICGLLDGSALSLTPIRTPFSIHANSTAYEAPDATPFDVSLDSYEHYFENRGFEFGAGQRLHGIRVMSTADLIRAYEVGLGGANEAKKAEYIRKLKQLRAGSWKGDRA